MYLSTPMRDFSAIPLDYTCLVRKALPLPAVTVDTGPCTVGQLQSTRGYAVHLLGSSSRWHVPLEVVLLANWALDGMVPVGDRLGVDAPATVALA